MDTSRHPYIDWPALLFAKCGVRATLDELRAQRDERHLPMIATAPAMAGVEQWILDGRRAGLPVAIASSSEREWIEPHLDRLGWLDHFVTIASWEGEHTGVRAKPAPDLYVLACEALGVAPEHAVAVEDSENGLVAAKAAGLWCIAVPNAVTAGLDFSTADLVLGSLADRSLSEALAALDGAAR